MGAKVFCFNKQLHSLLKRDRRKRTDVLYAAFASCRFRNDMKHSINDRSLALFQEKNNSYNLHNGKVFFYLSLLCVPLFLNQKFHNDKENLSSCLSLEKGDKEDKLNNLQKVFLLKKDEIKSGEMIEVKVHDGKDSVLLVNVQNNYYCLGTKCPHYSAPLKSGFLTKKYVTCPWHDAKFDLKTGECLNGPSFDDIPAFDVEIEGDNIYAYLPKEIKIGQEKKVCSCKDYCEKKNILIVGSGAASLGAIETFLKNGYNGRLIICSNDSYKPYDRTTLSKSIANYSNVDELYESIKLKSDEYYKQNNITFINDVSVTKIDAAAKKAYLNNGKIIDYDKVLIASGLSPRPSPIKNVYSNNLLNVYNLKDNFKLSTFVKEGSRCVIIGSSFIGCELASALKKRKVNVTMVTENTVPFDNIFGEKIGNSILNILKENDVQFHGNTSLADYILDKGLLNIKDKKLIHGVKLKTGEVLKCDYVVEALGCLPNSDFIDSKYKDKNNFIITDKYFRVKDSQDMFAAGDVCIFPYFYTNEMLNICHWNVAIQQGRIAAHNMLNDNKMEFSFLPFFNTNIMGNNFRICGFAKMYDKIIFEGDLSKKSFVGYFVKDDKIISILTLGNTKMPALNECLTLKKVPKPYELEAGLKNSDSMINSLKL